MVQPFEEVDEPFLIKCFEKMIVKVAETVTVVPSSKRYRDGRIDCPIVAHGFEQTRSPARPFSFALGRLTLWCGSLGCTTEIDYRCEWGLQGHLRSPAKFFACKITSSSASHTTSQREPESKRERTNSSLDSANEPYEESAMYLWAEKWVPGAFHA